MPTTSNTGISTTQHLSFDLVMFLCHLCAHDVRCRGRFITTPALEPLSRQLRGMQTWPPAHESPWRKEADAPYLLLLHFLCLAGGWVGNVNGLLKPTPLAAQWLASPPPARLDAAFAAAFEKPAGAALWRDMRLPGWRTTQALIDAGAGFRPIVHALLNTPSNKWQSARSALRWIEPTVLSDDPDTQPETLLRTLLGVWSLFGRIETSSGPAMRIRTARIDRSTWADRWPAHLTLQSPQPNRRPRMAHFETPLAPLDAAQTFALCQLAMPHTTDEGVHFALTRDTAQRAMWMGATPASLLILIEGLAQHAPSAGMGIALRRWEREMRQVRLTDVTLLETTDADRMAGLMRQRGVRQCIARTISPRVAVVRHDRITTLQRRLLRQGMLFPSPARKSQTAANAGLDQAEDAYLCLAAMLCQRASPALPAALRPPHAIIARAWSRLSRRDQSAIDQLLHVFEDAPHAWSDASTQTMADLSHQSEMEDAVREALQLQQPLQIVYTDAAGQTTERIIDPMRMDWQHGMLYLIAWCRDSHDERMFRISRMQSATPLPSLPDSTGQPTM